jgi:putative FmdB family regulatory protein
MPTYGYQCKECGHRFEVFQKITDPAVSACASCGGSVKKLLYPVGIQFKGSGFYVNDYTKNGAPKDEAGSGGDSNGTTPARRSRRKPTPRRLRQAAAEGGSIATVAQPFLRRPLQLLPASAAK